MRLRRKKEQAASPCCWCGVEYPGRSQRLKDSEQEQADRGLFIRSGTHSTDFHEVQIAAAKSPNVTPADWSDHPCPGVRAAYWSNPNIDIAAQSDIALAEPDFIVRIAIWRRADVPADVRDHLAVEFDTSEQAR